MSDGDGGLVPLVSAADRAAVPVETVRYWIDEGKLPAVSGPRGRLVRLADVRHLAASNEPGPDREAQTRETGETGAPASTSIALSEHTAPRRRHATASAAALMAKLDELYRAQIAAKDGEIAAKDELIAELRGRAERAERAVADLESRLNAEPPAHGLARLWPWRRNR